MKCVVQLFMIYFEAEALTSFCDVARLAGNLPIFGVSSVRSTSTPEIAPFRVSTTRMYVRIERSPM